MNIRSGVPVLMSGLRNPLRWYLKSGHHSNKLREIIRTSKGLFLKEFGDQALEL